MKFSRYYTIELLFGTLLYLPILFSNGKLGLPLNETPKREAILRYIPDTKKPIFNSLSSKKSMWTSGKEVSVSKFGVPKIIHQIWIGKSLPSILGKYMSTFSMMNGYYYKLWDNADLHEINFPKTWKYIEPLLLDSKIVYAKIADLMRLEILYHHGGIYVDATMQALQSMDVILESIDTPFMISQEDYCGLDCVGQEDKPYISSGFIVSIPGYKVLERLLSEEYLSQIDFSEKANLATGPYYVRTGIKEASEVTVLPTDMIYPIPFADRNVDELYSDWFSFKARQGFEQYNYFDTPCYIKIPCQAFPHAVTLRNWKLGGSWLK